MSDELTIQPQVQQKSNAVPYAAGGAIIGGLAGALSPVGVTKPKYSSYEDILKESEDTFNSQIEKGGEAKGVWEAAKEHAEKVKNAEAEYDKKVEDIKKNHTTVASALPEDNDFAKKLKEAQDNYTKEVENLRNSKEYKTLIQKAENELNKANGGEGTKFKMPTPDEVKNLGKDVALKEIKQYETLYNDYKTALKTARANVNKTELENFKNNISNSLDGLYNLSSKPKAWYKPGFTKKMAINNRVKVLENDIATLIPEISDSKRIAHEMKLAGVDYKPGSKNYQKFVKKLNEGVHEDRKNLLNEILGEKIQVDVIDPKTKKVTGKRTSYTNVEAFERQSEQIFASIDRFRKNPELAAFGGIGGLDTVENYEKALEKLEKDKGLTRAQYEAQKKHLTKGKELAQKLDNIQKSMEARYENFFNKMSYVQKLKGKMEIAIQNDPKVQSALQRMQNIANANPAIKDIAFETIDGTKLSAEEISQKAREKVETSAEYINKLKPKKDLLENAEKLAKEEAEKLGVKGDGLTAEGKKLLEELGTKENYTTKVKNAAKEAIEKDLGKIKTPNKLVNGLIAGTALALVGLGIGSSMKKDQA